MNQLQIITEDHLRAAVGMDLDSLQAVREGIMARERGEVRDPLPFHLGIPEAHGELHIKGGHLAGASHFLIKMASAFYENPKRGLQVSGGLVLVFDAATGQPACVFQDNGYLTDLRTGLAGAVSADALANPDVEVVAIIGTGTQARYQLQALRLVRSFSTLRIFGRSEEGARTFAAFAHEQGIPVVEVARDLPSAVRDADVILATTPATQRYLSAAWIKPGAHITAIGADSPGKGELASDLLDVADLLVADHVEQTFVRGELQGREISTTPVRSLGAVLLGKTPGRTRSADITVCDLIGLGCEDVAIGLRALEVLKIRLQGG